MYMSRNAMQKAAINNKMAARNVRKCSVHERGYYKLLNEGEDLVDVDNDAGTIVIGERLEDGVFEVERLIITSNPQCKPVMPK